MGDKGRSKYMEGLTEPFDYDELSNELIDLGKIKRQANICGGGIGAGRP